MDKKQGIARLLKLLLLYYSPCRLEFLEVQPQFPITILFATTFPIKSLAKPFCFVNMPTAIPVPGAEVITKFTNCRLLRGDQLVNEDLWISSLTGKIIRSQQAFYENHITPHSIIDLGGRILSPGLIDVQLNGAFGFDFSVIPDGGQTEYAKTFREVNKRIVETGVTAYLPTLTSQRREVYHQVTIALSIKDLSNKTRRFHSLVHLERLEKQLMAPNHWVHIAKVRFLHQPKMAYTRCLSFAQQ